MNRRFVAFVILLPALLLQYSEAAKPNIVLITIDTLRADHTGGYGYQHNTTPAIDKFAKNGLLFRNAYSTAPITLPSHASILTGVYPSKHGLRDNAYFPPSPAPLLSEILKKEGYATAAFVSAAPLQAFYGLNRGFDVYNDAGDNAERIAEETVDRALEWMTQTSSPYFLWIHLFDPHAPYQAPAEFASQFPQSSYDAEIAYTDSQIERILQAAGTNSIRIVTADHGESLGEHGESTHGVFVYNATLSVPLIIAASGVKPGVVDTPVSLIDIAPTVCELAGVAKQNHFSGESLLRPKANRMIFAESFYAARNFGYAPLIAAINRDHKYIHAPSAEFYNLKSDPAEMKNIIQSKDAADWKAVIQTYKGTAANQSGNSVELTSEQRETLASLGYTSGKMKETSIDPKSKIGIIEEFNRALSFLAIKEFKSAEEALTKIIRDDPNNSFAHRYLANAFSAQKRYANAAQSYEIAWQKTEDPEIAIQLAKSWNQLGRSQDAEKLLASLIQDFPHFLEPRFELASIYMKRKHADRALNILNQVENVQQPELYNQRGLIYLALRRFPEAEREFRIAAANGGKAVYWNNLGAALQNLNRIADAEKAFKQALKIGPNYAECEANLAFLLVNEQRWAEAKQYLLKASAAQPEFWRVRFVLGIVHEMLGENQEALHVYEKLKAEAPADWNQRDQLEARIQKLAEKQ